MKQTMKTMVRIQIYLSHQWVGSRVNASLSLRQKIFNTFRQLNIKKEDVSYLKCFRNE